MPLLSGTYVHRGNSDGQNTLPGPRLQDQGLPCHRSPILATILLPCSPPSQHVPHTHTRAPTSTSPRTPAPPHTHAAAITTPYNPAAPTPHAPTSTTTAMATQMATPSTQPLSWRCSGMAAPSTVDTCSGTTQQPYTRVSYRGRRERFRHGEKAASYHGLLSTATARRAPEVAMVTANTATDTILVGNVAAGVL